MILDRKINNFSEEYEKLIKERDLILNEETKNVAAAVEEIMAVSKQETTTNKIQELSVFKKSFSIDVDPTQLPVLSRVAITETAESLATLASTIASGTQAFWESEERVKSQAALERATNSLKTWTKSVAESWTRVREIWSKELGENRVSETTDEYFKKVKRAIKVIDNDVSLKTQRTVMSESWKEIVTSLSQSSQLTSQTLVQEFIQDTERKSMWQSSLGTLTQSLGKLGTIVAIAAREVLMQQLRRPLLPGSSKSSRAASSNKSSNEIIDNQVNKNEE
jgi:hypothetical protein